MIRLSLPNNERKQNVTSGRLEMLGTIGYALGNHSNMAYTCYGVISGYVCVTLLRWHAKTCVKFRTPPVKFPLPAPPPPFYMPDCGVHYLWFAFVCFLIASTLNAQRKPFDSRGSSSRFGP